MYDRFDEIDPIVHTAVAAGAMAALGCTNHSGLGWEDGSEGIADDLDTKLARIAF